MMLGINSRLPASAISASPPRVVVQQQQSQQSQARSLTASSAKMYAALVLLLFFARWDAVGSLSQETWALAFNNCFIIVLLLCIVASINADSPFSSVALIF